MSGDLHVRCPPNLLKRFSLKVGYGNISKRVIGFMENVVGKEDNIDEAILQKEFDMLNKSKEKLDAEWNEIRIKLENIQQQKEIAELERLKKEKAMKARMAHLEYETVRAHFSEMVK